MISGSGSSVRDAFAFRRRVFSRASVSEVLKEAFGAGTLGDRAEGAFYVRIQVSRLVIAQADAEFAAPCTCSWAW